VNGIPRGPGTTLNFNASAPARGLQRRRIIGVTGGRVKVINVPQACDLGGFSPAGRSASRATARTSPVAEAVMPSTEFSVIAAATRPISDGAGPQTVLASDGLQSKAAPWSGRLSRRRATALVAAAHSLAPGP
jgi:hypothetical protein